MEIELSANESPAPSEVASQIKQTPVLGIRRGKLFTFVSLRPQAYQAALDGSPWRAARA
jgi:hypothetical protein